MATYAIGDVQGCHETFLRLLDRFGFDPGTDHLWLVGDLVNRGPASRRQLRWVVDHEDSLTSVLGNHDLHLLAAAAGLRRRRRDDTFDDVLAADDREELLDWLARRPLIHVEGQLVLVHAGLLPGWSVARASELAAEVEAAQRDGELLGALAGRTPERWSDDLAGAERLASIVAALTRLRTCTPEGKPCRSFIGPPDEAPPGCLPWFDVPGRASTDHTIVFGHWASLGLLNTARLVALDTGCVWGRALTAVRLEDREVFTQPLADTVVAI